MEPFTVPNAPTPPIFEYVSKLTHIQLGRPSAEVLRKRTGLLAASVYEFMVVVYMRLLVADRQGVTAKRCFIRVCAWTSLRSTIPFMSGAVSLVSSLPHRTGAWFYFWRPWLTLFFLSEYSSFFLGVVLMLSQSLLAQYRLLEVKWKPVFKDPEVFLLYNFETEQVIIVPSLQKGNQSWPFSGNSGIHSLNTVLGCLRASSELFTAQRRSEED